MPSPDRRATGRRRAWGRGPINLKLESLEGRALLAAAAGGLSDLVNSALTVSNNVSDWGGALQVTGRVTNQGDAATTAPLQVGIYASPVRGINKYSVPIGQATIPAGVAPGESVPYVASVDLPSTPIPDVGANTGTLYVAAWVNPGKVVPESNYHNDRNLGPPYDATPVLIQPPQPADLVGTTLAVSTPTATWGSTITVTAQVTNRGNGRSPQTTALLSLTPQGLNYGDPTTVGLATITIPPLGVSQTYNVTQNVTLPAVAPQAVANYTSFGLTMTQDVNYLTNTLYPNEPDQGSGLDQAAITITTDPTSTATAGPLPDLAASSILAPTKDVHWGQSFPITTEVQNLGQGSAGPFQVFYLLTGRAGSTTNAIYLGQTTIPGLAAGASQPIDETLTLPTRLPSGVDLGAVGYARVAMIVDPQHTVNETLRSNDAAISAPFIVRLPGNATTVPTQAAASTLPSIQSVAQQSQQAAKIQAARQHAAKVTVVAATAGKKLHRRPPPSQNSLLDRGISLGEELYKLPHQVFSVVSKSLTK